jgi:hypothetical protein
VIGSSATLGIIASVAANPCLAGCASVVLEAFHEGRKSAVASENRRKDAESTVVSVGILRITRTPALAPWGAEDRVPPSAGVRGQADGREQPTLRVIAAAPNESS